MIRLLQTLALPLSFLYNGLQRVRAFLYGCGFLKSQQLPGYVISVGNIEAGGTGKTPITLLIAEILSAKGLRPAILTRGYQSGLAASDSAALLGQKLIMVPQSGQSFAADEARMQAARLDGVPVIIGQKRFAAALRYLQQHGTPTHWILDDGHQHLQIHRDLNIVLVDHQRPFDNGFVLPSGHLREAAASLKRADLVLATRATSGLVPDTLRRRTCCPVIPVEFRTSGPFHQQTGLALPSGQAFILILGIAKPMSIIDYLRAAGYEPERQLIGRDHELFTPDELRCETAGLPALVTTEKDLYRQRASFAALDCEIYLLQLTAARRDLEEFLHQHLSTATDL